MGRLWPLVMVVFLLLGSSYPRDTYVDERTSIEIVFTAEGKIFPKHWYSPRIDARVESLAPEERRRVILILNRAFSKYPNHLLREHLDRVYALKNMKFYGIAFGGTNVRNTVFLCNDEKNPHFTDDYVEGVFHHEFSSVLMRNFPDLFNAAKWESINDPRFSYGFGGVQAIRNGEASMALDQELFDYGLLTLYSQASVEEDVNVFAQHLFKGEHSFWGAVDTYPRIRQKARLLIGFYQKLDPRFNEAYFRNLDDSYARR